MSINLSTQWCILICFIEQIAFQCGVSFYHTMKGNQLYARVCPLSLTRPTSSRHHPTLGHHGTLSWAPVPCSHFPTSYLCNTRWCIYVSPLPIHLTFPFSLCPQCSLSMFASLLLPCPGSWIFDKFATKCFGGKPYCFQINDTAKSGFPASFNKNSNP